MTVAIANGSPRDSSSCAVPKSSAVIFICTETLARISHKSETTELK
jgi:hypothetical protein